MRRPKAGDQTWRRIYHSQVAEVFESDTENDFYKVVLEGQRPKFFYGELAFQNYQRIVHDYEMKTVYSQDYSINKLYRAVVEQSMTPTIYTKPNCVQCEATKRYFDNKGVAYTTVDITQDADALDRLIEEGYQAAPVVNAGTEWWSGFQPDKIDKYISDYS